MSTLQSIRGMRDVLPEEALRFYTVEAVARRVLESFGYIEIRLPLLEPTELFSRGVGETTDIVGKEMYTMEDREGSSITLRPEGTAGCVRAGLQHGLLFNRVQRLWYAGPMFRHEKPQKGRYRQFDQIGAEAFGIPGPEIDAELVQLCAIVFDALGVRSRLTLEINTLGGPEARASYRQALVAYLQPLSNRLDEDSRRRLERNPLRILDSKAPETLALLADAPALEDHLDAAAHARFDELRTMLDTLGVAHTVNRRLVRGLDYYTHTVFEWVTDALGSQGTVCAGGRYDGLVALLGGRSTPGVGFAMGVDRLVLLADAMHIGDNVGPRAQVDVYCIATDRARLAELLVFAQRLRETLPGLRVGTQAQSGKFDAELKRAGESGAAAVLIVGAEQAPGEYRLRWLRSGRKDERLTADTVIEALAGAQLASPAD